MKERERELFVCMLCPQLFKFSQGNGTGTLVSHLIHLFFFNFPFASKLSKLFLFFFSGRKTASVKTELKSKKTKKKEKKKKRVG